MGDIAAIVQLALLVATIIGGATAVIVAVRRSRRRRAQRHADLEALQLRLAELESSRSDADGHIEASSGSSSQRDEDLAAVLEALQELQTPVRQRVRQAVAAPVTAGNRHGAALAARLVGDAGGEHRETRPEA